MQDMERWTANVQSTVRDLDSVMPKLKSLATEAYNSPASALQDLKKSMDNLYD